MKTRLRGARWRLRRLTRPRKRAIILLYHSISENESCPFSLCVSPADFAEQLDVLSRRAHVYSLCGLLDALERGTLPDRSVAITFDDGYVDNLHAAKPLLERHGFPATVFVTAGLVGSGRAFWWDELLDLTLDAKELPRVVRLTIDGHPFSFGLGPDALLAEAGRHREWRFEDPPPTRRHLLYQTLWRRLQALPDAARRHALDDLRRQVRVANRARPESRIMDTGEVLELVNGGLIEVGAHTMTHPVLAHLPAAGQFDEIVRSKATLEQMLGQQVLTFAYPHGGRDDYSPATVRATREAGFSLACSTTEDWLRPACDRFQLPRVYVPPVGGADFERLLSYWL